MEDKSPDTVLRLSVDRINRHSAGLYSTWQWHANGQDDGEYGSNIRYKLNRVEESVEEAREALAEMDDDG